jgi:hypothetical protein
MAGMSKRPSNSIVAFIAAVALLLCQAAGVVHGRTPDGASAQQTGCHGVLDDQGQPGKAAHVPCDAAQPVGETLKLPAVTPVLLTFAAALPVASVTVSSAPQLRCLAHAGAPPPLHLLHCRLRN